MPTAGLAAAASDEHRAAAANGKDGTEQAPAGDDS